MRLIFKQRMFSWFDSYDIYDEGGNTLFVVKGQFAWGHKLKIFDGRTGGELATIQEKIFTWLPKFEMYLGDRYIGSINREFSWFKPKFSIDCNGWQVEGDFFEWDYCIKNQFGYEVARVQKELFNWTDTYTIDVARPDDALIALLLVVAIDAEKCSRKN